MFRRASEIVERWIEISKWIGKAILIMIVVVVLAVIWLAILWVVVIALSHLLQEVP